MPRSVNRSVARNDKSQNPSTVLPPDLQVASTNATASSFITTRARPEWLSPATNTNPIPATTKKVGQPRKPAAVKPVTVNTPTVASPIPQSHPQLQHQQVIQQPAQAVLPSPAPSNEPSPPLANAALDSSIPAFLPDAREMQSTTTPASATTPMLPRTDARFVHHPTIDTQNLNGQATRAAGEVGNHGAIGTSVTTPIDLESGWFSAKNGTPNPTLVQQQPPYEPASGTSQLAVGFKYSNLLPIINQHVDRHGGAGTLTPTLERPRLQLLSEACEKNDAFFIVLHQLFAMWSTSSKEVHDRLPQLTPAKVDAAFGVIEEILKKNQLVALPHRRFFETFPRPFDEAVQVYSPHAAAKGWVSEFLNKIVQHHRSLAESTWTRGYPYLVDELISQLGCFSPVLQMIFFTSNRRRLGVYDGPLAAQIEAAFKRDQDLHNNQPWVTSARPSTISRPANVEQQSNATIQLYRGIIEAARLQSQNQSLLLAQTQNQGRRSTVQSPVNFGTPPPHLTLQQGVALPSPVLPSQLLSRSPPQQQGPFAPSAANQTSYQAQPSPTIPRLPQPVQQPLNHLPQQLGRQQLTSLQQQQQQRQLQQQHQLHQQHQLQQLQQQQHVNHQAHLFNTQQVTGVQYQTSMTPQQLSNFNHRQAEQESLRTQQHFERQRLQQQQQWLNQERLQQQFMQHSAWRAAAQSVQVAATHVQQPGIFSMASPTGSASPVPANLRTNTQRVYVPPLGPRPATPLRHRSSYSLSLLIPDSHFIIPRPEWPYDSTDRKALHMSLHQAHLRSPKRILKNGDTEPVFQAVKSFAVEPTALAPGNTIQSFQFVITEEQFALAATSTRKPNAASISQVEHFNGALRWRLRCCRSKPSTQVPNESEWVTLDMNWPSNIFMRLNKKTLEVRRQPHNGKDLATELTDHIVCGSNLLEISVPLRHEGSIDNFRFLAVEMLETLDYSHVFDLVWDKGVIPEEQTLQIIKKRLTPPADDDGIVIEAPDLSIDLADPFSAVIFNIPARGASCTHMECFDLETWLKTRPAKPVTKCLHVQVECDCPKTAEPSNPDKWRCPICFGDARPYSLRIDEFMLKVRRELEKQGKLQTKCMHVKADGTWSVVLEDDDDVGSDDDGPARRPSVQTPTLKRKASATPIVNRRPDIRRQEIEVIEID